MKITIDVNYKDKHRRNEQVFVNDRVGTELDAVGVSSINHYLNRSDVKEIQVTITKD